MDIALLRLFETVAQERSFSRAGQKLFRSQPAISLAVKRLEEDLGAQLIDRSARTLRLTDAGREVMAYVKQFLALERKMRVALAELRDLRAGKLVIGANESTALYLLRHVESFRQRHPGIDVELRRSLSSRIPEAVLDGSLELGAISYDPGDPKLRTDRLYEDRLTFVVSPEHRFAARHEVGIAELGKETFIAHNVVSPYRAPGDRDIPETPSTAEHADRDADDRDNPAPSAAQPRGRVPAEDVRRAADSDRHAEGSGRQ